MNQPVTPAATAATSTAPPVTPRAATAAERNLVGEGKNHAAATPRELGITYAQKNALDAGIHEGIELVIVLCTIKKKTTSVPVVVPEHEVPILRVVHGEENVTVVDKEYGTVFYENDAFRELNRLRSKYDDKHTGVVGKVFADDVGRVAKWTGMDERFDPTGDVQQAEASVQVDKTERERKAAAKKTAARNAEARKATSGKK